MSRGIILELRRKTKEEKVERLRRGDSKIFPELTAKLARWSADVREDVRSACPTLPEQLADRMQDNWEPLLAIADVAGGLWPEQARQAALTLSGKASEAETMSIGRELLSDIREAIGALYPDHHIKTYELIRMLCADEEKRWATHNGGKQISPRQLSGLLSKYKISSKTVRIGDDTPKGYVIDDFQDAFKRYLP
jgi:putative DNA primase/helicase